MEPKLTHQFDPFAPGAEVYDEEAAADSLDLDHRDYNDPATLAKLLSSVAFSPTVSPRQLRAKTRYLSQNIFANYHSLQAILARHEATIQKRWAKTKN